LLMKIADQIHQIFNKVDPNVKTIFIKS
jgi:hypothetical protein